MRLHHPCVTMMYRYTLFLCFLSRTVIGDPIVEIIGNSSSTSCGNFTSLGGNFQSVTFKVTGDWGNNALDVFNTPYLRHANESSICALVNQQDKCAVQSNLHYTCTCENKTGGVYHLTFTSSPSYPLVSYAVYLTWANGLQKATSDYFVVEEVKNESCPCEVNWICIIVNSVLISAAAVDMVVLFFCSCCKKLPLPDYKAAWFAIFLFGLLLCIAVIIGLIVCYAAVKDCLVARETSFIIAVAIILCIILVLSFILFLKFGPGNYKNGKKPRQEIGPKQSNNSCRKDEKDSSKHDTENDNPKNGGTQDNNSCKSQISLFIVVEEQVFVNSLPAGGTGTENGKKKKALKKKETGDKNKGETSSPKPVKKASFEEGAVGRRGTEDSVEIPHTPLGLENQVSNHQGAAKSAGTDVVRNEKASGDKNSDRPSTTPPESQGKKEGKKALKNEANKNRRNSVPTKPSENQGTNVPENTKKEAWNEHTEKVQKQTGNKDDPQHKNKA